MSNDLALRLNHSIASQPPSHFRKLMIYVAGGITPMVRECRVMRPKSISGSCQDVSAVSSGPLEINWKALSWSPMGLTESGG
jgi:hypothetical protein